MIASARTIYNRSFSEVKYQAFIEHLNSSFNYTIPFRVAESPVFIGKDFGSKVMAASNEIIDFLVRPDYKKITNAAIPPHLNVPNETGHTLFLALDYAVVKNSTGELIPQLIEMQGFPSLFGWQHFVGQQYPNFFDVPAGFTTHFGFTNIAYEEKLKATLLNGHSPEQVVLLEIDPKRQNTAIDFILIEKITGIPHVHIGDVIVEGRKLFYHQAEKKIPIKRIFNRVIFDELVKRDDLWRDAKHNVFTLMQDVDVEWAGHPNWFFRISKFSMPFIKSQYIPECRFLNEYEMLPKDLENYVLKPLFSFSGSGVIFHITPQDITNIPPAERKNYLLQRKVNYEPVIQAPDGLVKAEIRILFIWDDGAPRPVPVTNLARLSRGEMIGVKYNKDKTWVGGSVCFFEQ
jgi:hypothetical protein